jgi:trans-aconitate methyltransferase
MHHSSHADGEGSHSFEKGYWEQHWLDGQGKHGAAQATEPNPYLVEELQRVPPGTALDAGCGTGAEAIWLAQRGWRVSAVDISSAALAVAAERAAQASVSHSITWLEADLTTWQPGNNFELVMTNYAHAALPQLKLYERIASWVAPGGTLLIVGHAPTPNASGNFPPTDATATATQIASLLPVDRWAIERSEQGVRDMGTTRLNGVVVRARRLEN